MICKGLLDAGMSGEMPAAVVERGTLPRQRKVVSTLEKLPQAVPVEHDGGVAKLYRLQGAKGNIGLISPISAHFCGECNRLRLTADGKLKPCLHAPDEYAIKGLDREGMKAVFQQAIWNKPAWHGDLDVLNRSKAGRNMNEIGG